MQTHHIRDRQINFHGDETEEVVSWLKGGLTQHGLDKLLKRAQDGEDVSFTDGSGKKHKLRYDDETGYNVHPHY